MHGFKTSNQPRKLSWWRRLHESPNPTLDALLTLFGMTVIVAALRLTLFTSGVTVLFIDRCCAAIYQPTSRTQLNSAPSCFAPARHNGAETFHFQV